MGCPSARRKGIRADGTWQVRGKRPIFRRGAEGDPRHERRVDLQGDGSLSRRKLRCGDGDRTFPDGIRRQIQGGTAQEKEAGEFIGRGRKTREVLNGTRFLRVSTPKCAPFTTMIYFGPSTTCFGKRGQDFTIPRTAKGITTPSFRSRKMGRNDDEAEMKKWDPNCPKCREEMERHAELWQAQYDDVDHGAGVIRLLFMRNCTHGGRESGREEDHEMGKENGPKDVPHWTQPIHIAPEMGTKPPVGACIAKDPGCRRWSES